MESQTIYYSIVLALAALTIGGQCASFGMADWDFAVDKMDIGDTHSTGPSVHHFARHGLCNDMVGNKRFFNAISQHLCDVSVNLKVSLVLDLCSRKDYVLDQWVAEMYDIDRDGFISHSERTFYKD